MERRVHLRKGQKTEPNRLLTSKEESATQMEMCIDKYLYLLLYLYISSTVLKSISSLNLNI